MLKYVPNVMLRFAPPVSRTTNGRAHLHTNTHTPPTNYTHTYIIRSGAQQRRWRCRRWRIAPTTRVRARRTFQLQSKSHSILISHSSRSNFVQRSEHTELQHSTRLDSPPTSAVGMHLNNTLIPANPPPRIPPTHRHSQTLWRRTLRPWQRRRLRQRVDDSLGVPGFFSRLLKLCVLHAGGPNFRRYVSDGRRAFSRLQGRWAPKRTSGVLSAKFDIGCWPMDAPIRVVAFGWQSLQSQQSQRNSHKKCTRDDCRDI